MRAKYKFIYIKFHKSSMKKILFLLAFLISLPAVFSFTSIQYQGCGFSSYESPDEIEPQEIITVDRRVQYYTHYEPCVKSAWKAESSLFRESSKIQKNSYVTCERVQGTNDYSCDRTDLSDEMFTNPRNKMYSYSSRFSNPFY